MKRQWLFVSMAVVLALGLAGRAAWADGESVTVNVPFAFNVGAKELPAGRYSVSLNPTDSNVLMIEGAGGSAVAVAVDTRLANLQTAKAEVVFDKADGKEYLSEVYIPGIDGFLLKGAAGKHTHVRVSGT